MYDVTAAKIAYHDRDENFCLIRKAWRQIVVSVQSKQLETSHLNPKDPFLKEILEIWRKFNYRAGNPDFASTCI